MPKTAHLAKWPFANPCMMNVTDVDKVGGSNPIREN